MKLEVGCPYYISNANNLALAQANAGASTIVGSQVTVNSSAEKTWLTNAISGSSDYWIGMTDASVEGTFAWASGSSSTYRNWTSGEPNHISPNFSGDADYSAMNASSWL